MPGDVFYSVENLQLEVGEIEAFLIDVLIGGPLLVVDINPHIRSIYIHSYLYLPLLFVTLPWCTSSHHRGYLLPFLMPHVMPLQEGR